MEPCAVRSTQFVRAIGCSPSEAVGWWVEARLLLNRGDQTGALEALDRLDSMAPRPEDVGVREAAEDLRRSMGTPEVPDDVAESA